MIEKIFFCTVQEDQEKEMGQGGEDLLKGVKGEIETDAGKRKCEEKKMQKESGDVRASSTSNLQVR